MKKCLIAILLLSFIFVFAASPGSSEDPLVTKSWVDSYLDKATKDSQAKIDVLMAELGISDGINLWVGKTIAKVDGVSKTLDVAPILSNGRTMVPLRFVGESFGATFRWDNSKKQVTYLKGNTTVCLQIDKKEIVVNGVAKATDTAAILVNNRTMVPLRVISESLGAKVNWINSEKRVNIIFSE